MNAQANLSDSTPSAVKCWARIPDAIAAATNANALAVDEGFLFDAALFIRETRNGISDIETELHTRDFNSDERATVLEAVKKWVRDDSAPDDEQHGNPPKHGFWGGELRDPSDVGDVDERQPLRQYIAVDVRQLLAHHFPTREFILSPVFTLGSLNMLYAWRGIGKTHVAIGIAYAAASGGSFLKWKATRPFRTLYIDGEMPGEALQTRLAAIVQAAEKEPQEGYLKFITIDLEGGIMPDLATREGHTQIAAECEQAELIVVDNLSCLVRGSGKENEANTWTEAAEWALSMRSKGKAVLFVHHAGKDGAQRGTSKREDLLDVSISLKRPSDYDPDQGARFEVRYEKARHLTGEDSQPFEACLQADEHGRQAWTIKLISESTFERVIELANLGLTQRDIAEELEVNKSTVSRAYRRAVDEGKIKIDPKPPQTTKAKQ